MAASKCNVINSPKKKTNFHWELDRKGYISIDFKGMDTFSSSKSYYKQITIEKAQDKIFVRRAPVSKSKSMEFLEKYFLLTHVVN